MKWYQKFNLFKRVKELEDLISKCQEDNYKLNLKIIEQNDAITNLRIHINDAICRLEKKEQELISANEAVLQHFNISLDHGIHQKNWAVICIDSKPEYVRFIDLNNKDIREISMFLKRFEGCNRIIDSPYIKNLYF